MTKILFASGRKIDSDRIEVWFDPNLVEPVFACPRCGNRVMDDLVWVIEDGVEYVECMACGKLYDPNED